ncbi:MAG: cobyrinic acid a,c-diamide synthase [Rhodospirillaceae bacterium]|nr:cobyrinic acid a,c-diamide synthase [Rhodospirillaceae bacterium]
MIAAPNSGSGKTVITLALLRALRQIGKQVGALKVGPDYIDPGFHRLASGRACLNIDAWAMRPQMIAQQVSKASEDAELIIAEGVMGLFDGAADGTGSTAELALALGLPVILVVDVSAQSTSVAAVIKGFNEFRDDIDILGVIFNRVGSDRHQQILKNAMIDLSIPVIGFIPRDKLFSLESRHLGLIQADEVEALDQQIDASASLLQKHMDLDALMTLARPVSCDSPVSMPTTPPPGQRVAVASDPAFSFIYDHILDDWLGAGASIAKFSPLADEAPNKDADAIYLPGGYPELHAVQLASNNVFLNGLRECAERGAVLYGECGGFMVLGKSLTDRDHQTYEMAGLLPVATSFADPKLCLGYRKINLIEDGPLGRKGTSFRGHEFHYSTQIEADGDPLFSASDALGIDLGPLGCRVNNVMGSYIHLIDSAV